MERPRWRKPEIEVVQNRQFISTKHNTQRDTNIVIMHPLLNYHLITHYSSECAPSRACCRRTREVRACRIYIKRHYTIHYAIRLRYADGGASNVCGINCMACYITKIILLFSLSWYRPTSTSTFHQPQPICSTASSA